MDSFSILRDVASTFERRSGTNEILLDPYFDFRSRLTEKGVLDVDYLPPESNEELTSFAVSAPAVCDNGINAEIESLTMSYAVDRTIPVELSRRISYENWVQRNAAEDCDPLRQSRLEIVDLGGNILVIATEGVNENKLTISLKSNSLFGSSNTSDSKSTGVQSNLVPMFSFDFGAKIDDIQSYTDSLLNSPSESYLSGSEFDLAMRKFSSRIQFPKGTQKELHTINRDLRLSAKDSITHVRNTLRSMLLCVRSLSMLVILQVNLCDSTPSFNPENINSPPEMRPTLHVSILDAIRGSVGHSPVSCSWIPRNSLSSLASSSTALGQHSHSLIFIDSSSSLFFWNGTVDTTVHESRHTDGNLWASVDLNQRIFVEKSDLRGSMDFRGSTSFSTTSEGLKANMYPGATILESNQRVIDRLDSQKLSYSGLVVRSRVCARSLIHGPSVSATIDKGVVQDHNTQLPPSKSGDSNIFCDRHGSVPSFFVLTPSLRRLFGMTDPVDYPMSARVDVSHVPIKSAGLNGNIEGKVKRSRSSSITSVPEISSPNRSSASSRKTSKKAEKSSKKSRESTVGDNENDLEELLGISSSSAGNMSETSGANPDREELNDSTRSQRGRRSRLPSLVTSSTLPQELSTSANTNPVPLNPSDKNISSAGGLAVVNVEGQLYQAVPRHLQLKRRKTVGMELEYPVHASTLTNIPDPRLNRDSRLFRVTSAYKSVGIGSDSGFETIFVRVYNVDSLFQMSFRIQQILPSISSDTNSSDPVNKLKSINFTADISPEIVENSVHIRSLLHSCLLTSPSTLELLGMDTPVPGWVSVLSKIAPSSSMKLNQVESRSIPMNAGRRVKTRGRSSSLSSQPPSDNGSRSLRRDRGQSVSSVSSLSSSSNSSSTRSSDINSHDEGYSSNGHNPLSSSGDNGGRTQSLGADSLVPVALQGSLLPIVGSGYQDGILNVTSLPYVSHQCSITSDFMDIGQWSTFRSFSASFHGSFPATIRSPINTALFRHCPLSLRRKIIGNLATLNFVTSRTGISIVGGTGILASAEHGFTGTLPGQTLLEPAPFDHSSKNVAKILDALMIDSVRESLQNECTFISRGAKLPSFAEMSNTNNSLSMHMLFLRVLEQFRVSFMNGISISTESNLTDVVPLSASVLVGISVVLLDSKSLRISCTDVELRIPVSAYEVEEMLMNMFRSEIAAIAHRSSVFEGDFNGHRLAEQQRARLRAGIIADTDDLLDNINYSDFLHTSARADGLSESSSIIVSSMSKVVLFPSIPHVESLPKAVRASGMKIVPLFTNYNPMADVHTLNDSKGSTLTSYMNLLISLNCGGFVSIPLQHVPSTVTGLISLYPSKGEGLHHLRKMDGAKFAPIIPSYPFDFIGSSVLDIEHGILSTKEDTDSSHVPPFEDDFESVEVTFSADSQDQLFAPLSSAADGIEPMYVSETPHVKDSDYLLSPNGRQRVGKKQRVVEDDQTRSRCFVFPSDETLRDSLNIKGGSRLKPPFRVVSIEENLSRRHTIGFTYSSLMADASVTVDENDNEPTDFALYELVKRKANEPGALSLLSSVHHSRHSPVVIPLDVLAGLGSKKKLRGKSLKVDITSENSEPHSNAAAVDEIANDYGDIVEKKELSSLKKSRKGQYFPSFELIPPFSPLNTVYGHSLGYRARHIALVGATARAVQAIRHFDMMEAVSNYFRTANLSSSLVEPSVVSAVPQAAQQSSTSSERSIPPSQLLEEERHATEMNLNVSSASQVTPRGILRSPQRRSQRMATVDDINELDVLLDLDNHRNREGAESPHMITFSSPSRVRFDLSQSEQSASMNPPGGSLRRESHLHSENSVESYEELLSILEPVDPVTPNLFAPILRAFETAGTSSAAGSGPEKRKRGDNEIPHIPSLFAAASLSYELMCSRARECALRVEPRSAPAVDILFDHPNNDSNKSCHCAFCEEEFMGGAQFLPAVDPPLLSSGLTFEAQSIGSSAENKPFIDVPLHIGVIDIDEARIMNQHRVVVSRSNLDNGSPSPSSPVRAVRPIHPRKWEICLPEATLQQIEEAVLHSPITSNLRPPATISDLISSHSASNMLVDSLLGGHLPPQSFRRNALAEADRQTLQMIPTAHRGKVKNYLPSLRSLPTSFTERERIRGAAALRAMLSGPDMLSRQNKLRKGISESSSSLNIRLRTNFDESDGSDLLDDNTGTSGSESEIQHSGDDNEVERSGSNYYKLEVGKIKLHPKSKFISVLPPEYDESLVPNHLLTAYSHVAAASWRRLKELESLKVSQKSSLTKGDNVYFTPSLNKPTNASTTEASAVISVISEIKSEDILPTESVCKTSAFESGSDILIASRFMPVPSVTTAAVETAAAVLIDKKKSDLTSVVQVPLRHFDLSDNARSLTNLTPKTMLSQLLHPLLTLTDDIILWQSEQKFFTPFHFSISALLPIISAIHSEGLSTTLQTVLSSASGAKVVSKRGSRIKKSVASEPLDSEAILELLRRLKKHLGPLAADGSPTARLKLLKSRKRTNSTSTSGSDRTISIQSLDNDETVIPPDPLKVKKLEAAFNEMLELFVRSVPSTVPISNSGDLTDLNTDEYAIDLTEDEEKEILQFFSSPVTLYALVQRLRDPLTASSLRKYSSEKSVAPILERLVSSGKLLRSSLRFPGVQQAVDNVFSFLSQMELAKEKIEPPIYISKPTVIHRYNLVGNLIHFGPFSFELNASSLDSMYPLVQNASAVTGDGSQVKTWGLPSHRTKRYCLSPFTGLLVSPRSLWAVELRSKRPMHDVFLSIYEPIIDVKKALGTLTQYVGSTKKPTAKKGRGKSESLTKAKSKRKESEDGSSENVQGLPLGLPPDSHKIAFDLLHHRVIASADTDSNMLNHISHLLSAEINDSGDVLTFLSTSSDTDPIESSEVGTSTDPDSNRQKGKSHSGKSKKKGTPLPQPIGLLHSSQAFRPMEPLADPSFRSLFNQDSLNISNKSDSDFNAISNLEASQCISLEANECFAVRVRFLQAQRYWRRRGFFQNPHTLTDAVGRSQKFIKALKEGDRKIESVVSAAYASLLPQCLLPMDSLQSVLRKNENIGDETAGSGARGKSKKKMKPSKEMKQSVASDGVTDTVGPKKRGRPTKVPKPSASDMLNVKEAVFDVPGLLFQSFPMPLLHLIPTVDLLTAWNVDFPSVSSENAGDNDRNDIENVQYNDSSTHLLGYFKTRAEAILAASEAYNFGVKCASIPHNPIIWNESFFDIISWLKIQNSSENESPSLIEVEGDQPVREKRPRLNACTCNENSFHSCDSPLCLTAYKTLYYLPPVSDNFSQTPLESQESINLPVGSQPDLLDELLFSGSQDHSNSQSVYTSNGRRKRTAPSVQIQFATRPSFPLPIGASTASILPLQERERARRGPSTRIPSLLHSQGAPPLHPSVTSGALISAPNMAPASAKLRQGLYPFRRPYGAAGSTVVNRLTERREQRILRAQADVPDSQIALLLGLDEEAASAESNAVAGRRVHSSTQGVAERISQPAAKPVFRGVESDQSMNIFPKSAEKYISGGLSPKEWLGRGGVDADERAWRSTESHLLRMREENREADYKMIVHPLVPMNTSLTSALADLWENF